MPYFSQQLLHTGPVSLRLRDPRPAAGHPA
jgi:hypothetical protein